MQWYSPSIRHNTDLWPCYPTKPYYKIWIFYRITKSFLRIFATDDACQQRMLTSLDTCPIWDACAPNVSGLLISNIPWYFHFTFDFTVRRVTKKVGQNLWSTQRRATGECLFLIPSFTENWLLSSPIYSLQTVLRNRDKPYIFRFRYFWIVTLREQICFEKWIDYTTREVLFT